MIPAGNNSLHDTEGQEYRRDDAGENNLTDTREQGLHSEEL